MPRLQRIFGVVVLALLLPSAVYAQASIAGTVKDTSGAVLPGVTVEVASPVLIEKVRTVVTDGNGRFQIVDLRPGSYTVTFSLSGFNTSRRDNVTLSGSATVTVEGELRVGALEETITVTGEAPVIDTSSTTRQQVLSADLVDALPSSRNYSGLARMIPGTSGGQNETGGSIIQDTGGSLTVHGSRNTDQRVTANGINTMTLQAGGNIGGQTPDVGSAAEVTVDTTSLSADLPTGGVRINFVPRDGGNRFSDSTFFTISDKSLQGSNFSDELKAAGLATPTQIVSNWDINQSIGGPFKRDKVWFWFSTRYNRVANEAGVFTNANAFKPNEWLYVPTTEVAVNKGVTVNSSIRVTYQVNPKLKVAGTYKADRWCNCPSNMSATVAPEAGRDRRFPRLRQEHAEFTSPVTNRLLVEGVFLHLFERWGNMHLRPSTGSVTDAQAAVLPQMISVVEQSTGMRYRGLDINNNTLVPNFAYRGAVSYVTGSHAFKTGFNRTHGFQDVNNYALNPISYRFNNGVPNQITERVTPYRVISNQDNDIGLFVQDKWALNRVTINLALRYDKFQTSFPEQHLGPAPLVPNRNTTFPAASNLNWSDISYRSGLAYDLGGNGKTAIKVAFNKYLLGQTLNGIGASPNPINSIVQSASRAWNDANRDYIPQCDLLATTANGECGALSDANFGTVLASELYDKDLTTGWGHRPANWEFSTSVQRELMPGLAFDVGYFRRIWKNFQVTDNLAVDASNFTTFKMTVPTDSRLETSGQRVTLVNVNADKFGQTRNLNTLSEKYGKQIDHWNGMDFSLNARLRGGVTLQAGVSTGKQIEDNCAVVAKLPELYAGANQRPAESCHREEPMLTQFKGYGIYTIPKVNVQMSGTFRSTPGTTFNANYTATNAYLGANSTLGRTLSGNAANITVALLSPNTLYTDRRNELDMRIGKVLRFGRSRNVISLDIYNALNVDAVIAKSEAYATWQRPQVILNARLMKLSWALDF